MLFHKYVGGNIAVKNCMSHFPIFVPDKDTVKFDNVKTGHPQRIGIILCCFPNFSIRYPVGQFVIVQVTLPKPSNWLPLKDMLDFKRFHMNLLKIVTLLTLKVVLRV